MRFIFDTEFIEDGKTIVLLSIGIVCEETGETFYRENRDADWNLASEWVKTNVLPHMAGSAHPQTWTHHNEIGSELIRWVDAQQARENTKIQFWAYYADYDWVALCQLFGTMMQLPQGFPMFCMDIKQLCMMLGNPTLPPQSPASEHHALADAHWGMEAFWFLRDAMLRDYGRLLTREMFNQERR